MENQNKLLNCPFCGGCDVVEEITRFNSEIWIECRDCGASTGTFGDLEMTKCRDSWNNRPIEDNLQSQLKAQQDEAYRLATTLKTIAEYPLHHDAAYLDAASTTIITWARQALNKEV